MPFNRKLKLGILLRAIKPYNTLRRGVSGFFIPFHTAGILILLILFASCSPKTSPDINTIKIISDSVRESDTIFPKIINLSSLQKIAKNEGINATKGISISQIGAQQYLTFTTFADSLVFFNIQKNDSLCKKVNIRGLNANPSNTIIKIRNDTLLSFDLSAQKASFYHIDTNFILTLQKQTDISPSVKKSGENIRFSNNPYSTNLDFNSKYLVLSYGVSGSFNFTGKNVFLIINLANDSVPGKFILRYPDSYSSTRIYNPEPVFEISNDNILTYAFMYSDLIGRFNLDSNLLYTTKLVHNCGIKNFDNSKKKNLGYVQKYIETTETTFNIFKFNGRFVLLKRLAKNLKTDRSASAFYIFNSNLSPVNAGILNEQITCPFAFKYLTGMLGVNDSLNTGYFYDFK